MKKDELEKLVNQEISCLTYYGYREDREKLSINSEIYAEIRSIGYTKRPMKLIKRCSPCILTSKEPIVKGLSEEKLEMCYDFHIRIENKYSPLEVYLILYPEKRKEIIEKIKNITITNSDCTGVYEGFKKK